MSWYRKRKPTRRKDLVAYNSYSWIMFSFNWLVFIWRGGREGGTGSFQIGRPRSKGCKNFEHGWASGGGRLGNWTIFMDVIFVSSLITQLLSGPSFNANKICANITQCLKKMHLTDRFNGNGKNNIYGKYEFCRFLFHKLWTYFNETDNFKQKQIYLQKIPFINV